MERARDRSLGLGEKGRLALVAVAMAFVGGAVALVAWREHRGEGGSPWSVRRVVPLAGGDLLLVERRGLDESTMDSARLRRLAPDGEVRASVVDDRRGALTVHALVDDVLWAESPGRGLHVRSAATLEPIASLRDALASHRALSRGHEAIGVLRDRLVLRAGDRSAHALALDGALDELPNDDLPLEPLLPADPSERDRARLSVRGSMSTSGPAELGEAERIIDARTGHPLHLGADAALVRRREPGERGGDVLARVRGGRVEWQLGAAQLVLDGRASCRVAGVMQDAGELALIVEAESWRAPYEGRPYPVYDARLVRIDARSGEVLRARSLTSR